MFTPEGAIHRAFSFQIGVIDRLEIAGDIFLIGSKIIFIVVVSHSAENDLGLLMVRLCRHEIAFLIILGCR